MTTPGRSASSNVGFTLEVHVEGREPYQLEDQWMVPGWATLGGGIMLPVRVAREDPSLLAIDWDALDAEREPDGAELRRAARGRARRAGRVLVLLSLGVALASTVLLVAGIGATTATGEPDWASLGEIPLWGFGIVVTVVAGIVGANLMVSSGRRRGRRIRPTAGRS